MGDRYGRGGPRAWPIALPKSRRPPPEFVGWARGPSAPIGHNQGPPLDAPTGDAFVRYRWRKAHREVWKNPSLSIMKMRLAWAEAAGVTYREYMLALLDSGRHLQAKDAGRAIEPLGACRERPPAQSKSSRETQPG